MKYILEYICTHNSRGLFNGLHEGSWEHPISEDALLVGITQEVCEQNKSQFQGTRVKVGLKEQQEPITSQSLKQDLLLTSVE